MTTLHLIKQHHLDNGATITTLCKKFIVQAPVNVSNFISAPRCEECERAYEQDESLSAAYYTAITTKD